jgi:hypothetical protein
MSISNTIALSTAILSCVAINAIGLRFLFSPKVAAQGYGIAPNNIRAFTAIKGVRDIVSGIVPIVVWQVAGQKAFGWVMVAAALTPIGDALIVLSNGGTVGTALGIHGVTAVTLVAAGLTLARGA